MTAGSGALCNREVGAAQSLAVRGVGAARGPERGAQPGGAAPPPSGGRGEPPHRMDSGAGIARSRGADGPGRSGSCPRGNAPPRPGRPRSSRAAVAGRHGRRATRGPAHKMAAAARRQRGAGLGAAGARRSGGERRRPPGPA